MSKTLRELRIEKGMTLGELAAALGCAVSGPGSWERGRYGPSPRQIPRLAAALGVTPEEARKAAERSRALSLQRQAPAEPRGAGEVGEPCQSIHSTESAPLAGGAA